MTGSARGFSAIVLAGDRGPGDPVVEAAGVASKSLIPVGGRPMVLRVLDAVQKARDVDACVLCGPPWSAVETADELRARVGSGTVRWIEGRPSPSSSAFHALQTISDDRPVLLTTADHALLSAQMVEYFCAEARATGCDLVAGVARHGVVATAYPGTKRTVTRLRDGDFCGCNLFAFMTPEARRAADFWRRVETKRKNPLRVVGAVGWMAILRYLLGRLSLAEGLDRLSRRLGFKIGVVEMPFAEAAIDVDTIDDWELVESIVAAQVAQNRG